MAAARTQQVVLVHCSTSLMVLDFKTCMIGPKISSIAIRISCTSLKTVRSVKKPWSPKWLPPHPSLAPSFFPLLMRSMIYQTALDRSEGGQYLQRVAISQKTLIHTPQVWFCPGFCLPTLHNSNSIGRFMGDFCGFQHGPFRLKYLLNLISCCCVCMWPWFGLHSGAHCYKYRYRKSFANCLASAVPLKCL